MRKDKSGQGCEAISLLIPIGFVVYLVVGFVRFFMRPDAAQDVLICLKGLALFAGIGILVVVLGQTVALIQDRIRARLVHISSEYLVRCEAVDLQDMPLGPLPDDLPEVVGAEPLPPVILLCCLTNYGLQLRPAAPDGERHWIAPDNILRFEQLSGGTVSVLILPIYYLNLFYRYFSQDDDPGGSSGISGELPVETTGDPMEIVVVCTSTVEKRDLKHPTLLKRPLKLTLSALDAGGSPHQGATRDLYAIIYKTVTPDTDTDDSWMYRSRPIYW